MLERIRSEFQCFKNRATIPIFGKTRQDKTRQCFIWSLIWKDKIRIKMVGSMRSEF